MVPERVYRVNFFARAALMLALGCQPALRRGVFEKPGVRYAVGEVPAGFKPVKLADNDIAYLGTASAHSIAVNASCAEHGDPPLEILTQHLLMGFSDREQVEAQRGMLDGRESLQTRWTAKLDGVPIDLLLVVLKKNGCVYDFTYLSPPGRLEEKRPAFEALLQRFRTES